MRQPAFALAGRLGEAEECGRAAYVKAIENGSGEALTAVPRYLATTLLLRGRVGEAIRLAREAAKRSREFKWAMVLRNALIPLAHGLALTGAAEDARATLAELDGLGIPAGAMYGVELLQSRAWTEVAGGDVRAARQHLEDAVSLATENGELVPRAHVLHDLARLGYAGDVVDRLAEVAGQVEGTLVSALAAHAAALVRCDADLLLDSSSAFEAMGADLLAAEAAADAAVAWRRAGDAGRAATAERTAQVLLHRCEGARTPALSAITVPAVLTAGRT